MKTLVLAVTLSVLVVGTVSASTPTLSVGPFGPPNPIASGRDVCFSSPPDINGLVATSEIIGSLGLETRIASAFTLPADRTVCLARWWGGYYNNTVPCVGGDVSVFNLYFYQSANCLPADPPIATLVVSPTITFVQCQAGTYPLYKYEATISQPLSGNVIYWFVAQATDHAFPPQWGRLATPTNDYGPCEAGAIWSPYFGIPVWELTCDPFLGCDNFSAEFECCQQTPVKEGSWGRIKTLYR